MIKPNGYWTKEKCKEEALKYNNKMDFRNKSLSAYTLSIRHKWYYEITSHMTPLIKPMCYWNNKNLCLNEALKYISKQDFRSSSRSAYNASIKNNWLDEICSHMIIQGNKYNRCIYSYEFSDNHVYVGLTYNIYARHSDRLNDKNDAVTKHKLETNLEPTRIQLTDYIDKEEAQKMEEFYKLEYKEKGWCILNRIKTGGLGGNNLKWTKEKCIEEALKYNTRNEFRINGSGAYYSATLHGWLDETCSHMIEIKKPKGYWTKEKCIEEALKYTSTKEFHNNLKGAYNACYKNKWLQEVCSHMK